MRILHLAKYHWLRSGGMERVVQDLAEGRRRWATRCRWWRWRAGWGKGRGQQSTVTRVFSFGALGSEEIAPGYAWPARRRADILHLHHPHPLADMACSLRSRKTPLVVTQHNDSIQPSARFLARTVIRRAAAVVVPSRVTWRCRASWKALEKQDRHHSFGIEETR
jgi:rhamnosyl/mannosyltransferase